MGIMSSLRLVAGKLESKRSLGRWNGNTDIYLTETWYEDVNWIHSIEDKDQ
jgi:hypothetical protein